MSTQRWKLTIEYDGSRFHGWQRQLDASPTVQNVLEDAVKSFCNQDVTMNVAGRTDAGVHAVGQVAHFDLVDRPVTGFDLTKALNALVRPHAVSILQAQEAPPEFQARYDARNKLYTYRVINRQGPPAIDKGRAWHHRRPLNVETMRAAARILLGNHDFTTFRDSDCQAKSPIKTLDRLDIETVPYDAHGGVEIRFHAEARSFLHHQVRNMVGTLMMVGDNKWTPDDVKTALEARDRTKGGPTAPSDGLYLVRVDY